MQSNIYEVSQVNAYIKNMFITDDYLQNIHVRGEISNLKYHSSGHIYFTLKDSKSAISCVMFASSRKGLKFQMREGMQIVVTGSTDVYERDGKYQIYAKIIEQDGTGDLFEQFERLKQRLSDMGMFDEQYKLPIPKMCRKLGVVTASTGAAVRDIINVSKRRNPAIEIILFPAIVQGEGAPASIVSGIKALERYGVDTIIVGRGGGSIEDLWGFNDESVAQAIFDCRIPIISAVGHETDFTIADFVADLRAATPSAAAELAVCDINEYISQIRNYKVRINRDITRIINTKRMEINSLGERIRLLSPINRLKDNRNRLNNLETKLQNTMDGKLTRLKHRIEVLAGRLQGVSPLNRLGGGFAYIQGQTGAVKSIMDVNESDEITVTLTDGRLKAVVTEKEAVDIKK